MLDACIQNFSPFQQIRWSKVFSNKVALLIRASWEIKRWLQISLFQGLMSRIVARTSNWSFLWEFCELKRIINQYSPGLPGLPVGPGGPCGPCGPCGPTGPLFPEDKKIKVHRTLTDMTSNNQRLGVPTKSKRSGSNAMLQASFTWKKFKTRASKCCCYILAAHV